MPRVFARKIRFRATQWVGWHQRKWRGHLAFRCEPKSGNNASRSQGLWRAICRKVHTRGLEDPTSVPLCRILLEKPTVAQIRNKFLAFHSTRTFITMFTKTRLTPRIKFLIEKLTVPQLVRKFAVFYGIWRLSTVSTKARLTTSMNQSSWKASSRPACP
jgi:hypothetical protein